MSDFLEYDESENLQNKLQNLSLSLDRAIDEKNDLMYVLFEHCWKESKRYSKLEKRVKKCKCSYKIKALKKKRRKQWQRLSAVYNVIKEASLDKQYNDWEREQTNEREN